MIKEIKVCSKCGESKPADLECFYKGRGKDGFEAQCKECRKNKHNQHYDQNKDKINERHRQFYELNKEEISERHKKYHKQNKDKLNEKAKQYRDQNKDKIKQYCDQNKYKIRNRMKQYYEQNKDRIYELKKQYYELNKDNISEKSKQYYEQNKEKKQRYTEQTKDKRKQYRDQNKDKMYERSKKYYDQNKDKINEKHRQYCAKNKHLNVIRVQRRRARLNKLIANLTREEWEKIKKDFNNECAYCGSQKKLEQEHFIPLSKGGEYTRSNIIPACKSCNSSKGASDFFDWYPKLKHYSEERYHKIVTHLWQEEWDKAHQQYLAFGIEREAKSEALLEAL